MNEVDPVILEVVARVNRYEADLKRSTRTVDQQLGTQERRVKALENQFRTSSSAISASLKGLAGTLAAGFSGRELVGLIDSYTRLQNSLKVTGLEGERLAEVQQRLFDVAQQNGVELEAVGQLYSRAAQNQKELGASTSDLIGLTSAVAASLRISGTSTQEASGALLQLGQALGSPRIQAEEFNSLLDTMQPLLREAAKNIEGTGGTLAGLTQRIKDTNGPGVSNVELFRAITAALADLEKQAASSQITIGGAFTKLSNALTTYVGEAAKANGVTGALATGIEKLADNLDTIIPALATIATVLGVRFVAAGIAGGNALRVLSAYASIATTSLAGTALAARGAGAALLTAFGGPVGAAITAVTLGIGLVVTQMNLGRQASGEYAKQQEALAKIQDRTTAATETLATATGKARNEAIANAKALRQEAEQYLGVARSALVAAKAKAVAAEQESKVALSQATAKTGRGFEGQLGASQAQFDSKKQADANLRAAQQNVSDAEREIARLDAIIKGATPPAVTPVSAATSSGSRTTPGAQTGQGPDLAAIEARYRDELDQIRIRINQAEGERARTAQERAEFEGRQLELAEDVALRSLEADQDYTEAQKAIVRERLLALGEAERDNIAFRERAQLEREALDILDERGRAEIDGLRLQFDLADTEAERRALALRILEAEEALLRAKLEATIASETAAQADIERARIALAALNAQAPASREATSRQFEGPLARFARNTRDTDTLVEEAAVRRIEDLNQTITDAMTNALGIKDPFLSQLIKIFLDKNVFGPLAEALSGAQGGGGGGFLSSLAQIGVSLFGRSSGGFVQAGRPYRVNEGASPGRVEAFVPNTSGQIIPLGRMNAVQSGGAGGPSGTVRVVIEEAPGFAATVRAEAAGVAVEVVRQSAGQIIDAAANETLRRASRPSL